MRDNFGRRDVLLTAQLVTARTYAYPHLPIRDLGEMLRAYRGQLAALTDLTGSAHVAITDGTAVESTGSGARKKAGRSLGRYWMNLQAAEAATAGLFTAAQLDALVTEALNGRPEATWRADGDLGACAGAIIPATGVSRRARTDATLRVGAIALGLRAQVTVPRPPSHRGKSPDLKPKATATAAYDLALGVLGLDDLAGSREYVRKAVEALTDLIDRHGIATAA